MSRSRPSRRSFLQTAGRAGLSLPLLGLGCTPDVAPTTAAPWGATPADSLEALLPAALRPEATLELFLWGGLSPWESFYVVPEHGDPAAGGAYAGQQWWMFQEGAHRLADALADCDTAGVQGLQPFGLDSDGRQVHLGPLAWPLRLRPDLLARMRVYVLRHDQLPHQGASPIALGGHNRGSARLAGQAAHVERFFGDRQAVRSAPNAYVLYPDDEQTAIDNVEAASAIGLHRAGARPLSVRLRGDDFLHGQLLRPSVAGRQQAVDAALLHYHRRWIDSLTVGGSTLDAPALQDWRAARDVLGRADALADVLTPEVLASLPGAACGESVDASPSALGHRLAAHLLTTGARHVTLVDAGLLNWGEDAPHDTHHLHIEQATVNVPHALSNLTAIINEPGEDDPAKLDLDRHQVLITTEFGRSPYFQPDTDGGTDHWPHGYVVVALGGAVDAERAGIVGAIGESGYATGGVTPQEFRAAQLLALGIWPFNNEAFAVGDVRGGSTELDAAMFLRRQVLGHRA